MFLVNALNLPKEIVFLRVKNRMHYRIPSKNVSSIIIIADKGKIHYSFQIDNKIISATGKTFLKV